MGNTIIGDNLSDIDVSQIQRFHLFEDNKIKAQIVTTFYNRFADLALKKNKIKRTKYLNAFDFFQKATKFKSKKLTIEEVFSKFENIKISGKNLVTFEDGSKARVNYLEDESIDRISYFDEFDHLNMIEQYDSRGFLSSRQIASRVNNEAILNLEQFLDIHGNVVLDIFYDSQKKVNNRLSRVILYDNNKIYLLSSLSSLYAHFFDRINLETGEDNLIISDRTAELSEPISLMKSSIKKVDQFHATHFFDIRKQDDNKINPRYFKVLNDTTWDAIIVPTLEQTKELIERFPAQTFITIPTGFIKKVTPKKFGDRKKYSVVVVSPLTFEKHQEQMISAVSDARRQNDDIRLDFYGREGDDHGRQLKNLVRVQELDKWIKFHDDAEKPEDILDKAQLSLMTSSEEAFSNQVLQAQAHGVPVVSFNVKYGPEEIIENGKTGIVQADRNATKLSQSIVDLFADQKKLENMSKAAYKNVDRYTENNILKAWQKLFKKVGVKI